MKFAVKTVTCLGCKTPLRSSKEGTAVCVNCRPKLPELYQKQVSYASHLGSSFRSTKHPPYKSTLLVSGHSVSGVKGLYIR